MTSADLPRCEKAAIAMVDAFYGGHLSQDRIAYYVYHELQNYLSPQKDFGDGQDVSGVNIAQVLSWALNGASIMPINGKPEFLTIQAYIDDNRPIIRDNGPEHLITVIDGYDTNGQMVYLIDPINGTKKEVPYSSLDFFICWVPISANITARSDEPTIWMDSDHDGVVDFDEINRFRTNPYNNDTYGLGINDKTVIEYIYMDNLAFPTASFNWTPYAPAVNQQVTFDASGNSGSITSYIWQFGDNNVTTVTQPTVNHVYSQQGIYNVTLTVNDTNGLWNISRSMLQVGTVNPSDTAFYRQSVNRDGYAMTEGPETPNLLWTSNLNGSISTSPVSANGNVFIGTLDGDFYALDLATGQMIWTINTGNPISTSPAYQNGLVFVGTENPGEIYAVSADTGTVKWQYPIPSGAAVYSSPAVIDGKVIAGSSDGNLFCLDWLGGNVLWTSHVGSGDISSPAVQNDTVFVTTDTGAQALDLLTGTLIWHYATTWPVYSCPAVADGIVFVGSENNDRVFALNESTGQPLWIFPTGGWLTPPAVDSSKQLVMAGSKDFNLYCLDEQTGLVKWKFNDNPNYLSAPTISSNGLVYLGTYDGILHCVNESTGQEVWSYNVTAPIISSATLIPQHVLVASEEGRIYCLGPAFTVHNIAISSLTELSSVVGQGYDLNVTATLQNNGDTEETFNVTAYANGTPIETKEVTLMNGSSTVATFVWNTTGLDFGNYTISAYAMPVPDQTNTKNNSIVGGSVLITIPGDLNGDFKVNLQDLVILASAYGSVPSAPNWNPNADIKGNGVVSLSDLVIVAQHYGQHYP
jgi:outer membrane protein assembly factor BamB